MRRDSRPTSTNVGARRRAGYLPDRGVLLENDLPVEGWCDL
ncbi:MAG: hypothetical protein ACLSG5_01670 [Oscillospiraceae bacterium]